jgi:hypothetical protein
MPRRLALAIAALIALGAVPSALADGDPASDVLPQVDVYYPYSPTPSPALVETLDALLADVRERGFPMKVAQIASAADLGTYPTMFNNPQVYANLLSSELPTNPHGTVKDELHLLIVMPGGFGGTGLGDRVDEALAEVEIDADAETDGLVRAAIEAVARLATVNGTETAVPDIDGDGDDGGGLSVVVIVAAVLGALALAALGSLLWRRRRASDERPEEEAAPQGPGPDDRSP